MHTSLLLIPFLTAFVGWFTNWIAIRMLFHPRKPRKIAGFTLQGIFPKKQQALAQKLGTVVSQQLFSFSDLEKKITHPDNLQKIIPHIEEHIDHFLRVKLAEQMPMISMFIGDKTVQELKKIFVAELETLFPLILQQYMGTLQAELDLEKIITEKVTTLSSDKLEAMLQTALAKELRLLGLLGGLFGFIIGLIQVLIGMH